MFYFLFAIVCIVTFCAFIRSEHAGPFAYISEIGVLTFQLFVVRLRSVAFCVERNAFAFMLIGCNVVWLFIFRDKLLRFQRSASNASADSFRPLAFFADQAFALGFFHKLSITRKNEKKAEDTEILYWFGPPWWIIALHLVFFFFFSLSSFSFFFFAERLT